MKKSTFAKRIKERKAQLLTRLAKAREERWNLGCPIPLPVIASNSLKYDLAEGTQAFSHGGLTALIKLATDVLVLGGRKNTPIPGIRSKKELQVNVPPRETTLILLFYVQVQVAQKGRRLK